MRELRILQWWPAAALVACAVVAGVVVTAVLSAGGGGNDGVREAGSPSPARTERATAAPGSPDGASACAPTETEEATEDTLYDELADGAETDDPSFEVTFAVDLGDDSARANADLALEMNVAEGNVAPKGFYVTMPDEWGVTAGCEIPIGLAIGTLRWNAVVGLDGNPCNQPAPLQFTMVNASTDPNDTVDFLDGDGNGDPDYAEDKNESGRADAIEKYPDFLNRLFPGRTPIRRTAGLFRRVDPPILAQSLIFHSLDGSEGKTMVVLLQNIGDPDADPGESGFTDYCTPFGFRLTDEGASGSGAAYYTNPPAGEYAFTLTAFGERDAEGDDIDNGLDTCPFDANVGDPGIRGEGDADTDGLDAACDPNDFDTNGDQDGDGHLNRADLCPLAAEPDESSGQADADEDEIGDECDTSDGGPATADGHVPIVVRAADAPIR